MNRYPEYSKAIETAIDHHHESIAAALWQYLTFENRMALGSKRLETLYEDIDWLPDTDNRRHILPQVRGAIRGLGLKVEDNG